MAVANMNDVQDQETLSTKGERLQFNVGGTGDIEMEFKDNDTQGYVAIANAITAPNVVSETFSAGTIRFTIPVTATLSIRKLFKY